MVYMELDTFWATNISLRPISVERNMTTITVTGTVYGSIDQFTAVWNVASSCVTCDYDTSPTITASLTVWGQTFNYSGGYNVIQNSHDAGFMQPYGAFDIFYINITVTPGKFAMNNFVNTFGGEMPGQINQPMTYVVNPLTDNIDRGGIGGSFSYGNLKGYLSPQSIVVTNPDWVFAHAPGPIAGSGAPVLLLFALGLVVLARLRNSQTLQRG
jgi:hypothetical protein